MPEIIAYFWEKISITTKLKNWLGALIPHISLTKNNLSQKKLFRVKKSIRLSRRKTNKFNNLLIEKGKVCLILFTTIASFDQCSKITTRIKRSTKERENNRLRLKINS